MTPRIKPERLGVIIRTLLPLVITTVVVYASCMRSAPVLLLDDDPVVLEHLPQLLMRRFPTVAVETFSSPREALLRFERRDYSVVVTGVTMPDMNGLSILEAVTQRRTATPVVLMTGHADESLMRRAFDLGAYDVLCKPLDRTEFTDVIQSAVETRALARRVQATQLILTKWKKRFILLQEVINGANDRPLDHLKDEALHMVLSSRRLNGHSLVTMGASIERLQQYVLINEKKLHEARQQVMACYDCHRRLAFTRGMRP